MEVDLEDFEISIDLPNQPKQTIGSDYEIPENLQLLSLINNRLTKIENLDHCTCLQNLCLKQNKIEADSLNGLRTSSKSLKKLDLYENLISGHELSKWLVTKDESGEFVLFPDLLYLDLSFNPIRQLSWIENESHEKIDTTTLRPGGPLNAFPKLQYLYFVDCKITTVPHLSVLTDLRSLELGSNRIREIEGFDELSNLTELWLGRNKITTIQNLNLPQLNILSLQSNRITKIQGLDRLFGLRELYLSENGIEIIEGLSHLKNLEILDLGKNRISVIQGLEGLERLEELWMNSNQISSFTEVEKLAQVTSLQVLYLEYNPISQDRQYRNKVTAAIPQLLQLDAIKVIPGANPLTQNT